MSAVQSFLDMGGYAGFIWSAYGIATIVLAALIVASLRAMHAHEAELAKLQAERPRRRRRQNATDSDDA